MLTINLTDPANESSETLCALARFLIDLSNQKDSKTHKYHTETLNIPETENEVKDESSEEPDPAVIFGAKKNNMFTEEELKEESFSEPDPAVIFAAPKSNPNEVPATTELDSRGLRWDIRINTRSRSKNKDGEWKKLRGLDPKFVQKVEIELRSNNYKNNLKPELPAENTNVYVPPAIVPYPVFSASPPPPPLPSAMGFVPPPPPALVPEKDYFIELMDKITNAMDAGKLSREKILLIVKRHGVDGLPDLDGNTELIAKVSACVDAEIL